MSKRAKPEEVIAKVLEIEIRLIHGETAAAAAHAVGLIEQITVAGTKNVCGRQTNQV